MKAIADDKFYIAQNINFFFYKVENIVGKWENAGYQHFCPFSPQCYQKPFFLTGTKVVTVW